MPADSNNGSAPNLLGLSDEETAQLQAAAINQAVAATLNLLLGVSPGTAPGSLEGIIRAVFQQQQAAEFNQILDDVIDPEKRKSHPIWGVRLFARGQGQKGKPVLFMQVQKDPSKIKTADEMLQFATVFGMVTNPNVRALLLAHGYEPYFFQSAASLIIQM
jgi:hypothetical protein